MPRGLRKPSRDDSGFAVIQRFGTDFALGHGLAGVVVPESVVTSWMEQADGHDAPDHGTGGHGETEEQP